MRNYEFRVTLVKRRHYRSKEPDLKEADSCCSRTLPEGP